MTALLLSLLLAANPAPQTGGVLVAKGERRTERFTVEVARTPLEQQHGLMGRASLNDDQCMFFLYERDGRHQIWMKNCLIPLDVVWIRDDGTVVETSENTPPCPADFGDDCPVYGGTVTARHFVEFKAGTLQRIGLRKGDRLGWDLILSDGQRVTGGVRASRLAKKATAH